MKKTILKAAVATALIVPTMVMAEATVYGNVHLSLNAADNDIADAKNNLALSSNTSSIGVKGSEDLGDGMKAIYKVEFGVDIANKYTTEPDAAAPGLGGSDGQSAAKGGTLNRRDQWVGLKGGMGTVKFGTMSSNYKQMGGKVDPLYRTPLEGRGWLSTQSRLHGGAGIDRGRMTNTVQYSSPKMGGIQLVANTTFSGAEDETMGVGVRYKTNAILAYVDWIDGATTKAPSTVTGDTQSAVKVGGKFSADAFSIALQWEGAEDQTKNDYLFLAGTFNIDKNNMIALTAGQASNFADNEDTTGIAVAYNHKLSKMTNVYAGYGAKSADKDNSDESMFTVGIKKKF